MQTHRQIAKHKTVLWQIAAGGVLALVIAAAALSSVGDFFAPPRQPITPPQPPPPVAAGNDVGNLSISAAANTLKSTTTFVPKPADASPTEIAGATPGGVPGGAAPAAAAPQPGEWAYLGSIVTAHDREALVSINGDQQILGVGEKHDDDKLVTIDPEFIEVEMGGTKHKVELASRKLMAPTDAPKHLPNFSKPPTFPSGPNAPMAMGQPQFNMRPGVPGSNPAATLEQQRAQSAALAAAEAARRNQGAVEPPMIPVDRIDPGQRDAAAKLLSDPGVSDDERLKHLSNLGITPGTPVDAAVGRLKESGIDLGGDNYKRILNTLEINAKSGK